MSKVRSKKWIWWALAGYGALQVYFVRELFAAEILFGLLFGLVLLFVALFYLVGKAGERGLVWAESHARELAPFARRGLHQLEEISRKPFRRLHSESAR